MRCPRARSMHTCRYTAAYIVVRVPTHSRIRVRARARAQIISARMLNIALYV